MFTPESQSDRKQDAIRRSADKLLGLNLSDQEIESLLDGDVLSLEQLLQTRSLGELGVILIRLDSILVLNQDNQESNGCPDGYSPVPPPPAPKLFCYQTPSKPPAFRLHPNWLD